jgi:hypothetical protein
VINSPFTRWEGDDIHGRRPVLTSVRVNLDLLFPRPADAPRHVIVTGLDLTGMVPGQLHGRFSSVEGSPVMRDQQPNHVIQSDLRLTSIDRRTPGVRVVFSLTFRRMMVRAPRRRLRVRPVRR